MSLSLKISRLEDYKKNVQKTGLWNRIIWLDNGTEVVFMRSELDFDVDAYVGTGWLMEFDTVFYHDFMMRYNEDFNSRLFAVKNFFPIKLPVTDLQLKEISELALSLQEVAGQERPVLYLQTYADLIFLNLNRWYVA